MDQLNKNAVQLLATVVNLLKSDQITMNIDGKNAVEYGGLVNKVNTLAININDNVWQLSEVERKPDPAPHELDPNWKGDGDEATIVSD